MPDPNPNDPQPLGSTTANPSGPAAPGLVLQPVRVRTDGGSHEGRLVLADGDLVAVFVRVSGDEAADDRHPEGWFLEAGFGPCGRLATVRPPVFATLEEATAWVVRRLGGNNAFA